MSSDRFPFCFALAVWLAAGAASAQTEGEGTTWTDPPARTAPQEPASPAESTPAPEAKAPEPARSERRSEPERSGPTQARPSPPTPTQDIPTQAEKRRELRQEQIRRAVDRSTAEREAEARGVRVPRRSVVERPAPSRRLAERPVRLSERPAPSLRESRTFRPRSIRRPVYGYADPMPAYHRYEAGPQVYDGPDYRARRLAPARSAGYIVMRSRSYAYPDGTVVRRLLPLDGGDDFYD